MKKSLKYFLIVLLMIILIFHMSFVYAIEKVDTETIGEEDNQNFFEISKLEVTKNDKIEMTINFENIEYNNFLFELESSQNMQDIQVLDSDNNLDVEKNNNEISFEINKETTNLTNIILYYQIPENVQINDKITFVATITDLEADKSESDIEEDTKNNTEETVGTESAVPKTQTIELTVTVVEENEENIEEQEETEENIEGTEMVQKPEQESENSNDDVEKTSKDVTEINNNNQSQVLEQSNVQKVSNTSNYTIQQTTKTNVTEQTITYNGSDNNYLGELYIDGYTLNKEFSKDNSTYFVTVDNDVESLNTTAIAEDTASVVCVYGNDNLKEGTNKILITVTAENGNVRNYRIYVIKNA